MLKVFFCWLVLLPLPCCLPAQNTITGTDTAQWVTAGPPQMINDQFSFTEGPACDQAGNIYFTDQPDNKIWEYSISHHLSVFMDTCGRSNGMYFDRKGNLITCADEHDQLWAITPNKKIKVLVSNFRGHRLNGPNDVWVNKNNGIYFTDPYYQRNYWKRTHPDIQGQNVYYLPPNAAVPVIVINDLEKPNGIIGTPDGKYLFVADIGAGKTYRYKIAADGSLQDKQLFVNQGSDGMTIDNKGDIYLTGKGVTIFDSLGQKIEYIPIPQPWTGNICFGGKHLCILFITASKAIYIVPMKVHGYY
jgi:gluconolactonase